MDYGVVMEHSGMIWSRLRDRAERVERQNPFDPRSCAAYTMILFALAVEAAYLAASDFTVSTNITPIMSFLLLIWMAFCGLAARSYGFARVGTILEALTLPPIAGALTAAATVFLTRATSAFADELLVSADRAMGFEWMRVFSFYRDHPQIVPLSRFVYNSMMFQLPLIPLGLFVVGRDSRGWVFITAWVLMGIITALVYPMFPAAGPHVHFGISPQDLPEPGKMFPWTTGQTIEGIRSGRIHDMDTAMAGLVSFPSFHTAAAVMFAWAAVPLRWIRFPVILLNVAMVLSTIVSGSHYFIDLIGGVVVAVTAIVASKAIVCRIELRRGSRWCQPGRELPTPSDPSCQSRNT